MFNNDYNINELNRRIQKNNNNYNQKQGELNFRKNNIKNLLDKIDSEYPELNIRNGQENISPADLLAKIQEIKAEYQKEIEKTNKLLTAIENQDMETFKSLVPEEETKLIPTSESLEDLKRPEKVELEKQERLEQEKLEQERLEQERLLQEQQTQQQVQQEQEVFVEDTPPEVQGEPLNYPELSSQGPSVPTPQSVDVVSPEPIASVEPTATIEATFQESQPNVQPEVDNLFTDEQEGLASNFFEPVDDKITGEEDFDSMFDFDTDFLGI